MSSLFEKQLENMVPGITEPEIKQVCAACIFQQLRKKQIVLREGEVCRHKIFVVKGLLRNFGITGNGAEHIVRFTEAGNWTSDPESYFNGGPSKYNIDALERSEIALFSHSELAVLIETIPALDAYFRKMTVTSLGIIQQRVMTAISATPEEKYMDFMQTYPGILQRVPLYMVASYLGLSRETLTRVRQGLQKNNVRQQKQPASVAY